MKFIQRLSGEVTQQLTRGDLYRLEQYAGVRNDIWQQVIAHNKHRHVPVGVSSRPPRW